MGKLIRASMNILVTGASRGIGYELVKLLSTDPTNTVFATSRNDVKLAQLEKGTPHRNVIPVKCDLSVEAEVLALTNAIRSKLPSLDILINNAGAIVNKPFAEITREDIQYVYEVNVFGVVRLTQHMLPLLSGSAAAHVVNISSMGGFQGSAKFSGLSAYSSSKAALVCLTECLAEEFREKNIAFNCLTLGATQTEMLEEAFPGYKAGLGAREMAEFIAGFAMKAHYHMNGKVIPVSKTSP